MKTPYLELANSLFGQLRILALVIIFSAIFIGACSSDKSKSPTAAAQSQYSKAKAEYDAGNYSAAITDFLAVLSASPDIATHERAQYFLSLSYYYTLDYQNAESQLTDFIAYFDATVTYYDAAHYWRGRARQKLHNYSAAITDYQYVIANNTSVYVDNAAFQIGNANYENAVYLLPGAKAGVNTGSIFDLLINAISALSNFKNDVNYAASSYQDDAAYFLGRTYQRLAELYQVDANVVSPTGGSTDCNNELTCYDNARREYATFISNTTLAASVYADSALYFTGRSYQSQTIPNYTAAITAFQDFLNNTAPVYANSTLRDDAQYEIGLSYYNHAKDLVATLIAAPSNTTENSALDQFQQAATAFNKLILSPGNGETFIDVNRKDNAFYFRGRALERATAMIESSAQTDSLLGLISIPELAMTPPTLIDMYDASRNAFQALLDLNVISASSYADNAQLEIGVLYQNQANSTVINPLPTDIDKLNWLAQAESAYLKVDSLGDCLSSTSIPPNCITSDNAFYNRAKVYADALKTTLGNPVTNFIAPNPFSIDISYGNARAAFQLFINTYATSGWVNNAYYHMADLSRIQGVANTDPVLLQQALNDYTNVILHNPGAQYVDNAVYQIGVIYHDYSPPFDTVITSQPSAGCSLANDWFSVYLNLGAPSIASYQFSYSASPLPSPVTIQAPLLLDAIETSNAQTHVDAYTAGSYDCNDGLAGLSLSTVIDAPLLQ